MAGKNLCGQSSQCSQPTSAAQQMHDHRFPRHPTRSTSSFCETEQEMEYCWAWQEFWAKTWLERLWLAESEPHRKRNDKDGRSNSQRSSVYCLHSLAKTRITRNFMHTQHAWEGGARAQIGFVLTSQDRSFETCEWINISVGSTDQHWKEGDMWTETELKTRSQERPDRHEKHKRTRTLDLE